jgi:hypothetical protein
LSVLLSFVHCVVCPSVFCPLCCLSFCLLSIVLSVLLRFTAFDYHFKLFSSLGRIYLKSEGITNNDIQNTTQKTKMEQHESTKNRGWTHNIIILNFTGTVICIILVLSMRANGLNYYIDIR